MWTSERERRLPVQEAGAELGVVTLGGDPVGVNLGGERRWLPLCSPGGFEWRPRVGDRVLVVKTGAEREIPCVVGRVQAGTELGPGETRVSGGDSAVYLGRGRLDLRGNIRINGTALEEYIRQIVVEILREMEG